MVYRIFVGIFNRTIKPHIFSCFCIHDNYDAVLKLALRVYLNNYTMVPNNKMHSFYMSLLLQNCFNNYISKGEVQQLFLTRLNVEAVTKYDLAKLAN